MDWLRGPRNFDIIVNYVIGRWKRLWSHFGGHKRQTISDSLGQEEAIELYKLWKAGNDITKITDIKIPSEHILGEFSSDLCDLFQRYHALRSINWDHDEDKELMVKYPRIKEVVNDFLKAKGIKED